LMDQVIASPAFTAIEEGATVVAPTFATSYRGIAWAPNRYWTAYVRSKAGKHVQFADEKCATDAPCYVLMFRQGQHSDDQFIVLAKVMHQNLLDASEMTVYSMPGRRGAVVIGSFTPGVGPSALAVDDVPVENVSSSEGIGLFSAKVPAPQSGRTQVVKITGNVGFNPDGVIVSHFNTELGLRTWSARLAQGIDLINNRSSPAMIGSSNLEWQGYPDYVLEVSGMSGQEPWGRWTDASVGPIAKFRFRQPLPKRTVVQLTAGAFGPNVGEPVQVRVGSVAKAVVIAANRNPDTFRLVFDTDGTADTLEIAPPRPTSPHELNAQDGDMRKLGVSLFALRIHELPAQTP